MTSLLGSFRTKKAKGRNTLGTDEGNRINSLIRTRFKYYFVRTFCDLGEKEVYKSDWFAFKGFAFLMDKDEPRETLNLEKTYVSKNCFLNINLYI